MCSFEGENYIVNFCPTKVLVKEKVSNRIVKLAFPNFENFSGVLSYSNNHSLEYFCSNAIQVEANMDSLELRYEMFRKNMKITVDWPAPNLDVEIGEVAMENGIFQLWSKEIELNNKDFIVELQ